MEANPNLLIPPGIALVAGNLKTKSTSLHVRASSCHFEWLKKTAAMILILGATGKRALCLADFQMIALLSKALALTALAAPKTCNLCVPIS